MNPLIILRKDKGYVISPLGFVDLILLDLLLVTYVQTEVDLFASQTNMSASDSSIVDPFAIPNPVVQPEIKASKSAPEDANIVDPFTAVLLNDFNGSDFFNAFTHSDSVSSENSHNGINDGSHNNLGGKSSVDSSTPLKKDAFQVK